MKTLEELRKELIETGKKLQVYRSQGDNLNDDQMQEYKGATNLAAKLQVQIEGMEQAEKAAAVEAAQNEADVQRRIHEEVDKAVKSEAAKSRRLPFADAPYQAQFSDEWKYDQLDATELSLFIDLSQNLGVKVNSAAFKAMSRRVAELKDDNTDEGRKNIAYVKGAFKLATGIDPEIAAVDAAIKAATDPMYTGASPMSDWVGAAYSQEIWRTIRANCLVASKIPSDVIPDGYSSKTWPLESTDMTWYKVAEVSAADATMKVPAATVTASQIATSSKQITVGKMGARSMYSGEAEEDSLIGFAPQLRTQLEASGQEILEHVIIDGDVETSANKNVNDIAGTPAATDVFLLFDGLRKLALVTNTANSRSASGGFVIEDFAATLKLLGTAGIAAADPSKVGFIVDGNVHWAAMNLPEVKTKDVHSAATIENGFLKRVYNVEILPSWQMHRASTVRLANTAGKVDVDTVGNNTTGSILGARWDQWKQAYKRRMTMEVTRFAESDSWQIVALMRWGLAYRDTEASAITYNVGI